MKGPKPKKDNIKNTNNTITNSYLHDSKEIMQTLRTSPSGISDKEAKKRLDTYGENKLANEKKLSILSIFLSEFKSIIIIILIIAALVSFAISIISHTDDWIDGLVIILIVISNAIFGFIQDYNSEKAIEALKKLTSIKVTVIRNSKKKQIKSNLLVPGDIIYVSEGDKIAADALIFESSELKVDESSLTGESIAVTKNTSKLDKEVSLGDRKNILFSGTNVIQGTGKAIVVATGKESEIGKISSMMSKIENKMTPLQKRLDSFGRNLSFLILIICTIIFLISISKNLSIEHIDESILIAISLAVAAIPEGLPAVVTVSLALGVRTLVKKNALIRKLPAVETLGCTSIICTDKTGTLTKNEMTVLAFMIDDKIFEIGKSESLLNEKRPIIEQYHGANKKDIKRLFEIGAECNNAKLDINKAIGDPTESALLYSAKLFGIVPSLKRIREIPFTSNRKMMSVEIISNKKRLLYSKGATDILISKCSHILSKGKIVKLDTKKKKKVIEHNNILAGEAYRILGFAYKEIKKEEEDPEKGLIFVGLQAMIDPLRQGVIDSVKQCRAAGIDVAMITGDYPLTAQTIGKQLGLKGTVVSGIKLEEAEKKGTLKELILNHRIFARVSPKQKLDIVKIYQSENKIVSMTGDGVNDSPALKKADIGIAMGINGTEVAKEASDMILTDNSFSSITSAVFEGRRIYDNIKKFITYMLSTNVSEVMIIFFAMIINSAQLPLTAVQLLWLNLLTDGFPAIALGVDPARKELMHQKPRDPKENILNKKFIKGMMGIGLLITAGVLFLFEIYLHGSNISTLFNPAKATTISFTSLVIFELVLLKYVREKFNQPFFSNKYLILALAAAFALQFMVLYIPFFNYVFKTTPLGIFDWIIILSSTVFLYGVLEVHGIIRTLLSRKSVKN